jgi:gluconolactonase
MKQTTTTIIRNHRIMHAKIKLAMTLLIFLSLAISSTALGQESGLSNLIAPGTKAEELGSGYGFSEGPAADGVGNIYFSDGKNDTIHFYPYGRRVQVYVDDSTDANGMMFNNQGKLYVCEGAAYRIVAFDLKTKEKEILAHVIDGTHFNEPNDLTIDPHGGFYFTDPNYRHRGQETVMKEDTYYVSKEGEVTRVSTVCEKPNGILLTPDGKTLYLADNRKRVLYKYDVLGPGKLANETLWIDIGAGPDGMTLDAKGNLYIACGRAGIKVFSPEGKSIGTIGEEFGVKYASNCVFGGPNFSILYCTASDKFLGIPMRVEGMRPLGADSRHP